MPDSGRLAGAARGQRGRQRQLFGRELLADLGADAHQVAPRRLGMALAEGQLQALGRRSLTTTPRRAGSSRRGGARACRGRRRRAARCGCRRCARWVGQADQRLAQLRQHLARLAPGRAEIGEQAVERRLAVERRHHVVGRGADAARAADRLAALRDARHQRHLAREGDARQAALQHAVGDVQRARARRGRPPNR